MWSSLLIFHRVVRYVWLVKFTKPEKWSLLWRAHSLLHLWCCVIMIMTILLGMDHLALIRTKVLTYNLLENFLTRKRHQNSSDTLVKPDITVEVILFIYLLVWNPICFCCCYTLTDSLFFCSKVVQGTDDKELQVMCHWGLEREGWKWDCFIRLTLRNFEVLSQPLWTQYIFCTFRGVTIVVKGGTIAPVNKF